MRATANETSPLHPGVYSDSRGRPSFFRVWRPTRPGRHRGSTPAVLSGLLAPTLPDSAPGFCPLPPGPHSCSLASLRLDGTFATPSPGPRSWRDILGESEAPDARGQSWPGILDFVGQRARSATTHEATRLDARTQCRTTTGDWPQNTFRPTRGPSRQHTPHHPTTPSRNDEPMCGLQLGHQMLEDPVAKPRFHVCRTRSYPGRTRSPTPPPRTHTALPRTTPAWSRPSLRSPRPHHVMVKSRCRILPKTE